MLSETEFSNIVNWLPYTAEWPVDRNKANDNINGYFGLLISDVKNNKSFSSYQTQDGGLSNYLEFICYPKTTSKYDGPAIMLCISLCAPIGIYGQTTFHIDIDKGTAGYNFIDPEMANIITDESLILFEPSIVGIFKKHNIDILAKTLVSKELPLELIPNENLNFGNQYLHGLFQWID